MSADKTPHMSEHNHNIDIEKLAKSWMHPEIDELDKIALHFNNDLLQFKKLSWLPLLRTSLGISAAGIAEKLGISRQAVAQYEQQEKSGHISIQTMRSIATAIECEFVYGFIPKKHKTFAEMITAKALPFVQAPPVQMAAARPLSELKKCLAYGSRIKKFLSRPTGKGKLWKLEKALKRDYNWIHAGPSTR